MGALRGLQEYATGLMFAAVGSFFMTEVLITDLSGGRVDEDPVVAPLLASLSLAFLAVGGYAAWQATASPRRAGAVASAVARTVLLAGIALAALVSWGLRMFAAIDIPQRPLAISPSAELGGVLAALAALGVLGLVAAGSRGSAVARVDITAAAWPRRWAIRAALLSRPLWPWLEDVGRSPLRRAGLVFVILGILLFLWQPLAVIAVFAFIFATALLPTLRGQRSAALQGLASRLGLAFGPPSAELRALSAQLLTARHHWLADGRDLVLAPGDVRPSNVLSGTWRGVRVSAFDVGVPLAGIASCAMTDLPRPLPALVVERRAGGYVIGEHDALDIQLESGEFGRAYRIRCADRRFATAVLDPAVMGRLLELRVSLEIVGDHLLCYMPLCPVEHVEDLLGALADLRARIPGEVFGPAPAWSAAAP